MIEDGLFRLLKDNVSIPNLPAEWLFPLLVPDDAEFPAASFQLISSNETYLLDGPLGLVKARVQIDCWARNYGHAKALAGAIYALLNGYAATLPNGVVISTIQRDDAADGYDQEPRLYRARADYLIWYSLPDPS